MTSDEEEKEANAFAMELLMPTDWLLKDLKQIDIGDDKGVARLAKKYGVAKHVMAMRIGQLIAYTERA